MSHRASCSCGQLYLEIDGEPVRVSLCHCLACQRRTGSVFGAQARFHRDQVKGPHGHSTSFTRIGDSGGGATFQFCPTCGAAPYWQMNGLPDYYVIALGAFADPTLPWTPKISVYEDRAFPWSNPLAKNADVEHWN